MRDLVSDTAPATGCAAPILTARGLSHAAGGRPILESIDLALAAGRRTLIMGANGAGKSVLLRVLHGLLPPSAGEVRWHGAGPVRRAQAMVFQRPVMLRRSVLGNLRFALGVHGWRGRARDAKAAEALEAARLTGRAYQPARLLSGGEQQRLAVARALACEPELLFLDEPTSSLDPASTQMIEDLVSAAHARGVTIVMVTHDLGQARRMGDDVVFLHHGRVAERGPRDRVLGAPRSEAARAWLEGRLYTGLPS
jgi:tungstate transport system ATP-binding protein